MYRVEIYRYYEWGEEPEDYDGEAIEGAELDTFLDTREYIKSRVQYFADANKHNPRNGKICAMIYRECTVSYPAFYELVEIWKPEKDETDSLYPDDVPVFYFD